MTAPSAGTPSPRCSPTSTWPPNWAPRTARALGRSWRVRGRRQQERGCCARPVQGGLDLLYAYIRDRATTSASPRAQADRAAWRPAAHHRPCAGLHRRPRRAVPGRPQPRGRARGCGRAELAHGIAQTLARIAPPRRPQRPAGPRFDQDLAWGGQPARPFWTVDTLLGAGTGSEYDGYLHFDYKPPRTEDLDDVWEQRPPACATI